MAEKRSSLSELKSDNFLALLFDAHQKQWIAIRNPVEIIRADSIDKVAAAVQRIEEYVSAGFSAAGFLTYEASAAFDRAINTQRSAQVPLLLFAVVNSFEESDFITTDENNFYLRLTRSIPRSIFSSAFCEIKNQIRKGKTYQVNFTHKRHYHFCGDPFSFFKALCRQQPTAYAAWIQMADWAICSVSPELFFRLNGDEIICQPMKGTRPRGKTTADDLSLREELARSAKDRAENVMIVDMIRNDLGRIGHCGSVHVDSLYDVTAFPTVWQMTSTVRAKTDAGLWQILSALFPCSSITGAPKIETMRIIDKLETEPRSIYTGAIGLLKPERNWQFSVAIRTAFVEANKRHLEYGIGSGVVWDSNDEWEFQECLLKGQIVDKLSQPLSLLETMLLNEKGEFVLLDEHLARMKKSAAYFGFPFDHKHILAKLETHRCIGGRFKIRFLLSEKGHVTVEKTALPDKSHARIVLGLASDAVNSKSIFLRHKTTHRHIYDKARESAPDCDDVILYNERGEITECTKYNIALEIKGQLWTPPVESGLLPGTMRARLLAEGVIKEAELLLGDLERCQRIVLFNSVRGMVDALYQVHL